MLDWSTINGRPIKRDRLFFFFFLIKNLAEFWQKRRHFYIYIYIYIFFFSTIYNIFGKKNFIKERVQIFNPSIPHQSVHSFWGAEWRLGHRHAYLGNFQEASFNSTYIYFGMVSFHFIHYIFYFSIPCFIHFNCRSRTKIARKGSFAFYLAFWPASEWQWENWYDIQSQRK